MNGEGINPSPTKDSRIVGAGSIPARAFSGESARITGGLQTEVWEESTT